MEKYIATRTIDELGRIVLPIQARNLLQLQPDNHLEVWVDTQKEQIVLRKPYSQLTDIHA